MMNHIAVACCPSSVLTATTELSLAADKVTGRDSDLGLAWTTAEKKNPKLACCGREDRKAAESQSFAKDAREHWQGEPSASSSCVIFFYYLGDGTLLESTPWRCLHQVSPEVFSHFTVDSQKKSE